MKQPTLLTCNVVVTWKCPCGKTNNDLKNINNIYVADVGGCSTCGPDYEIHHYVTCNFCKKSYNITLKG